MIIPRINVEKVAVLVESPVRGPWEFEAPTCAEIGQVSYFLDEMEGHERENSSYDYHHYNAVLLCKTCPHLAECLSWGTYHEAYGIWGGTTPNQRMDIRRHKGITLSSPQYSL